MKTFSALIGAISVVLALAGCAGAADPGASTTPSTSPTGSPTTSPAPKTTAIVIGGDELRFVDATGGERGFGYAEPVADVLSAVEHSLGPQTGTTEVAGTNHTVPATAHEFGALTIYEEHYSGAVDNDVLLAPVWTVSTKAAAVGGVSIATSTGVAVGSSVDDIPGHADADRLDVVTVNGAASAYILVEASSGSVLVPDGVSTAVGVLASAETWPGPITRLSAPTQFAGA
ncbi:hypothetical protein [Leifsonia aquatica]|uniref:Lipoprotein n=2 Tax=Leifsonia aquatica TaxID=144185 RepID=U2RQR1_LEIAQ|nr:hypothetical protein [Leifsonia aquatica]ERK71171.1 hypothetical protein N136_02489 [Leifsonia aquatica ATCC 14665]MBB2966339.1 hypothetical protein [Leifsonia aquatica]